MIFIYLDESGDLGFDFKKQKTSKYFVIAFLITDSKRPVEKLIKNIFASFNAKETQTHNGMLHSYKEKAVTRRRLLTCLAVKDVQILSVYLDKQKVRARLPDEKPVIYNFVTNVLLDRLIKLELFNLTEKFILVASRRETSKSLNDNFKQYLASQAIDNHKLDIQVDIKTPQQEKCLQVVDMVCWAIYRKWEYQDEAYYNLIKEKIVDESPLFP